MARFAPRRGRSFVVLLLVASILNGCSDLATPTIAQSANPCSETTDPDPARTMVRAFIGTTSSPLEHRGQAYRKIRAKRLRRSGAPTPWREPTSG